MQEILQKYKKLQSDFLDATKKVGLKKIEEEIEELKLKSQSPGFWDNSKKAGEVMSRLGQLEKRAESWQAIGKKLDEVKELCDTNDIELKDELISQLNEAEKQLKKLKKELKFAGEHDEDNAIMSIYAGAGGTDAQDWAEMLERMYLRYFENNGFKASVVDRSSGEEAGIKNSTILVKGDFAYGKLKSEHGVHRLVRLSPYNADNLRQTSFAKVDILPELSSKDDIEIDAGDLKIDVFRAGGHGGQSVNTTDSAVRVTHNPTGIVVTIQNERSQTQNKETAIKILKAKLARLQQEQHQDKLDALKGPNTSAEWGNQIRSYVLHPYKMVKDLRTNYESSNVDKVLDGDINGFIEAYLEHK